MFEKVKAPTAGFRFFMVALLSLGLGVLISQSGCGGSGGGSSRTTAPGSTNTGTGTGTGTGSTGTGASTGKWVDARVAASPFCFTWTTPVDADQAWLEMTAQKIKDCNVNMYKATEGQARLGTQYLSDNAPDGNITIENLDAWSIAGGGIGCCDTQRGSGYWRYAIRLCGQFRPKLFLHEFCHGQFEKIGEEYSCSICVMSTYKVGKTQDESHYCDSGDCMVGGEWGDCWGQFILKKYPSWHHDGRDPGSPGDCAVEVTNN